MKKVVIMRKTAKRGRGIYALKEFKTGEIIESCPVITLTPKERLLCERTILDSYIYPWKSVKSAALVLGYGSIYNHSYEPNADWKQNFKQKTMVYRAIKPIKVGEEITVNYNGEPDDLTPIKWEHWDKSLK